jgi:hypothetical protein
MKLLLLSYCISLLAFTHARASCNFTIPIDTVVGQSQLAKQLAGSACQQLAAEQASFATMSNLQAQEVFEHALSATIEGHIANIKQVAAHAKTASAYEQLQANLPTTVAVQLIRNCPAAAQLYARFSNSAPAEDAFVKSWGDELCQRLEKLQANGMFKDKTSAERIELYHQEFNASLVQRGPQIMQLYGAAGNSQPVLERLSSRNLEYMQQHCLPSLMLLKGTK